jgi:membrane fusion protein, heavy metal efflux system
VKHVQSIANAVVLLTLFAAVGAGAWWLVTYKPTVSSPDKPPPAASVGKVVKEDDLNTLALTEEAEKRIGLAVTPVQKKSVRRVRVYGGEVTVPIGRTILVSAPLAGILKAPPSGELKAGQAVEAGQVVFQLSPILTPDGRATMSASLADAEGQVNNAKTQVNLTKIALDRAKRVLTEGAGSQRQVDEAQAAHDQATKTLDATATRFGILNKMIGGAETGTTTPIPIEAPESGILRIVSARAGQTVPSGAALFEIIDISTVWIRVPLPVGDMDGVDRIGAAQVGRLSAAPDTSLSLAKPVAAPPSANPLAATVDVFYELPNLEGKLIPGQRLGITVPLADAQESLTVPWSAVVYDIHGGTWVYEQVGPRRYTRRRVVVGYTVGTDAVLASGPSAGAKVVTAGVQELFGAETGFVK